MCPALGNPLLKQRKAVIHHGVVIGTDLNATKIPEGTLLPDNISGKNPGR